LSNSSIIKPEDKNAYKVQKYSFANLATDSSDESAAFHQTTIPQESLFPTPIHENEPDREPAQDTNTEPTDNFEQILKKQDELSSEIIKLQMQLEHQKEDYENRLEEESKRAYEDGYNTAMEESKSTIEAQANETIQRYCDSIQKMDEFLEQTQTQIDQIEPDLTKISVDVAYEIIQKEVSSASQEIAHAIAHSLIQEINSQTEIELKVNPEDYDYITEQFKDKKHIIVTKDSAITKGGVIILSDIENIDASIKTRFENAKKLIK
jgi:flagellar assembly protein FliH